MGQSIDFKQYQRILNAQWGDYNAVDCCSEQSPTVGSTNATYSGQHWKLSPLPGGYYKLSNLTYQDYYCLDVDGQKPLMKKEANTQGQRWKFIPAGNGYYYISNAQLGDAYVLSFNNGYQMVTQKNTASSWKLKPMGPASAPISPKGKVSDAIYTSIKAVKLMDQTASKIEATRLLDQTPVKWITWDDNYYYTSSGGDPNNPWVSNWHLIKAYTNIPARDAMTYAQTNPNIKFFVYVNAGGSWNEPGKGIFQPYTALFFSYQQPIYKVNPSFPPGGLKSTTIYEKVDYLNQHIINAQKHSRIWRSSIRNQMMEMLKDVERFGSTFDQKHQSLYSLATKITNGNNAAIDPFKNELRILQQITQQAAQKARSKEPAFLTYLDQLAVDVRNFTSDLDKVSSQLAGTQAEVKQLKANIEEYQRQRRKNFLIDIFVPIMGYIDAAKGNSEKLEQELRRQEHQLQTAEKESFHLKAISGRLDGLVQASRTEHASIMALIHGWDALNADFNELIEGENISTEMIFWIQEQLSAAKNDWKTLRQEVRSLNPR